MSLSYNKVGAAYKKTQTQSVAEVADPHAVVLAMLDELLKAMRAFANNADLKAGGDREVKSKSFARSLTIIYALQSSLDFEKGGDIANNLFQLYEYARQQLLKDMREAKGDNTQEALPPLTEIRDAWEQMREGGLQEQD